MDSIATAAHERHGNFNCHHGHYLCNIFFQTNSNKNIKAPSYWSFVGESLVLEVKHLNSIAVHILLYAIVQPKV